MSKHWGMLGRRRVCHSHSHYHGASPEKLGVNHLYEALIKRHMTIVFQQHSIMIIDTHQRGLHCPGDVFSSLSLHIVDGGHMHSWVQVLFCEDSPSAPTSGPRRALQHCQSDCCLGAGLRGSHLSRQRW